MVFTYCDHKLIFSESDILYTDLDNHLLSSESGIVSSNSTRQCRKMFTDEKYGELIRSIVGRYMELPTEIEDHSKTTA